MVTAGGSTLGLCSTLHALCRYFGSIPKSQSHSVVLQMLELVLEQLERFLQREQVLPSFQNLVGCICIASLAKLAAAATDGHPCIAR